MNYLHKSIAIVIAIFFILIVLTPIHAQQSTINKYEKNPMRYEYAAKYGDYMKDLDPPFDDTINGKKWYTHFLRFPITYWIGPCKTQEREQILEALKQYALYFPLQEVKTKSQAFMIIESVPKEQLKQLCGNAWNPNILGCGGGEYGTSKLGANIGCKYKGYLYLKQNIFSIPGSITVVLHELGHAFGIRGHSKSPDDIMYYAVDTWALMSKSSRAKKIPTHLTYRDVNTLFMIYNDWYDN